LFQSRGAAPGFGAEANHVTGSALGLDSVAEKILVGNTHPRGTADAGEQAQLRMPTQSNSRNGADPPRALRAVWLVRRPGELAGFLAVMRGGPPVR
jgi:hypothetical protein